MLVMKLRIGGSSEKLEVNPDCLTLFRIQEAKLIAGVIGKMGQSELHSHVKFVIKVGDNKRWQMEPHTKGIEKAQAAIARI